MRQATDSPSRASRTLRSTAVIAGSVAIAYVASFAAQVVMAAAFGAGPAMDTYFLGLGLANAASVVVTQALSFHLTPMLVPRRDDPGQPPLWMAGITAVVLIGGFIVAAAGVVGAPLQVAVLSGGGWDADRVAMAVRIARLCWLNTGLYFLLATLDAAHHARRSYLIPGLALSAPYLGMIVLAVWQGRTLGPYALAVGMLAGNLLTVPVRLVGVPIRSLEVRSLRDQRRTVDAVRGIPLAVLALLILSIAPAIDTFWAPRLGAAQLSYLGYATRLTTALTALLVLWPSVILFPRFVEVLRGGSAERFHQEVGAALRLATFAAVTAAAAGFVLRYPVVAVILQRGGFDAVAVDGVARILGWLLVSLIPQVGVIVLLRALFAAGQQRAAAGLGGLGLVTHFGLSGVFSGHLGIDGIGVSYVLTWAAAQVVALYAVMGRSAFRGEGHAWLRTLGRAAACCVGPAALAAAVVWGVGGALNGVAAPWRNIAVTGAGTAVFGGTFLVVAFGVVRPAEALWAAARLRRGGHR